MNILILDEIDENAREILKNNGFGFDVKLGLPEDEIANVVSNYEGIIVRSGVKITKKIIDSGKKLKVIGRAGVGVDNIDVEHATSKGIVVMNSPLGNVNAAAEHTVAMILALSRHIQKADYSMKKGLWERKKFHGNEMMGKKIGLIGVGNVGKIVAKIMQAFNASVYAYDPFVSHDVAKEIGVHLVDLDFLLRNSDYISVHVPLNDKTKNMIEAKEFEKMKQGVKIINVGRGGIINENALYEALQNGKALGAAIDVWENEPLMDYKLAKLDNVLATPHLGASTEEAQRNVAIDVAQKISDFLKNGVISGAVNSISIGHKEYAGIGHYIALVEKLGSLCVQISSGGIKRIEIHYRGKIAEYDTRILTPYAIKGVLKSISGYIINEVNSLFAAKERNIKVVDSKSTDTENFSNLIRLIITTDKDVYKVNGTVFDDKKARILKINDFDVDILLEGALLICYNKDVPEVVGSIGTVLGSNKINIGNMYVGRDTIKGLALNVIAVDNEISNDLLEKIKGIKNVIAAQLAKI